MWPYWIGFSPATLAVQTAWCMWNWVAWSTTIPWLWMGRNQIAPQGWVNAALPSNVIYLHQVIGRRVLARRHNAVEPGNPSEDKVITLATRLSAHC